MFLDVFGICQQDADGQRLFLFGSEFKQVEFTQHGGEKFEKNVYFVHAAAATSTARNS